MGGKDSKMDIFCLHLTGGGGHSVELMFATSVVLWSKLVPGSVQLLTQQLKCFAFCCCTLVQKIYVCPVVYLKLEQPKALYFLKVSVSALFIVCKLNTDVG